MRILIVEDDEFTATALATILEHQNYAVEFAMDGQAAWDLLQAFDYDLIILDVMLPKLDGISLCRVVRKHDLKMPILLLTGKDSSHDKAMGLDAGADDYLVKPFDAEELVARVRALLRRSNSTLLPVLEWGSLRLDTTSCQVTYSTQLVKVTPKEYALLELFLRNPQRMYSCSAILDRVWSFDNTPGEEAVRTQIKGLRQKLKAAGAASNLIETVYGIGYRLKPIGRDVAGNVSTEENQQQQTLAALAGVWDRFKDRVSQQVSVIEQAVEVVWQNTISRDAINGVSTSLLTQASQEAHTLAGSLGTFGLNEGSQLAACIENYLHTAIDNKQAKHLRKLVQQLRKEIEQPPQYEVSTSVTSDESPKLLIIDRDIQLGNELVTQAEIQGVTGEVATSLFEAQEKIRRNPPNVVLLDPAIGNTTEEGLALLAQLQQTSSIPVLIFTASDSLGSRLEVARLGSRAFLQKPLPVTQVMEAINHVLQPNDTDLEAVVMVVDDDPQILATLRTLLIPWGIKVITLEDPRRFWETLEASTPDLLVLDIKMPHVSGIELCQVVRNDVNWGGLPILFLTGYTDATTVHQVFGVGADDFVSKPIVGPEVVTRILNRLERVKLLRTLAETDPLTTVYNRNRATQDLNKFLRLSVRQKQPLCLAILDVDNFKYVNDTFGHATGDAVLRRFGQLLRRSFRSEDVVSRWGGEEFVVGMYAMSRTEGVQRLNKVRETLHQQEFIAVNKSKFRITFSAGVAQCPENGTDLQSLYMSADAALYQAKAAGRDRVVAVV
ncbi:response regulator [Iningainema tapete]|uniref:Response regulator n=1 Tax=Iningainema tapete BLCC-T55 TaxID=2748662 RepID=A0A8J6XE67_9CYAN|nr:response regulator [Iningainema tapete]MBD2773814.1 response regulator [Iningainema tapete BLCC-T55]